MSKVTLSRVDEIAVIRVDNPPVNALSCEVRQGLLQCVQAAHDDDAHDAILIACSGRTFIAGADISEFDKPAQEPHLPDVLLAIEQSSKPVCAALFGTVLGGGLELALACHYRVALGDTRLGFPEVSLGLIPGAGGTQRLPRLIGAAQALEMIVSGKPRGAEEMARLGLLDVLFAERLEEQAVDFLRRQLKEASPLRRVSDIETERLEELAEVFESQRHKASRRPGFIAPLRCVESIENALRLPFAEGIKRERAIFLELRGTPQAAALRHAFFAENACRKVMAQKARAAEHQPRVVGVLGAGLMGRGIATCFASAGMELRLVEQSEENLHRGLAALDAHLAQRVARGRLSEKARRETMAMIRPSCDLADLADVDLVVEAVFEELDIKREVFARLDEVCKKEAVLATNTSYLDIDRIAELTQRPERVLGMHFFSPADVMRLVEVIRAKKTEPGALAVAMAAAKRLGKIAVEVGQCYGFVGNRMYSRYGSEAQQLLLEGLSVAFIDQAMEAWGMAMGPLAVSDLSGLDIGAKARRQHPNPPDDPCWFRPANLLVAQGRLGRKSGAGYYRYEGEQRFADPWVDELFRAEAKRLGVEPVQEVSAELVQSRLISALSAEGEQILAEGIVTQRADIDVIWLNGYGFPRFRGGPMFSAE